MYKVIFDAGKPYETMFKSINGVEKALTGFYLENKDSDYPYDCKVFELQEVDITETQLITEMIAEIMERD